MVINRCRRRIRRGLAVWLVLLAPGTAVAAGRPVDDAVATLVARLADVGTPWAERSAAEDALVTKPAGEVLIALLPHIGKGMPPGGIWNSAGRRSEEQAPAAWQAYYAVGRVWDGQIGNMSSAGGGAILGEILAKAPTPAAKVRVLYSIARRSWPGLEPAVAKLLRDEKEPVNVRTAAALPLVLYGSRDYHADLLAAFDKEPAHTNRKLWFERLVDPRHKARSGVDPQVVARGFALVEAERAAVPAKGDGSYFLVVAIGSYVGQDFMPPQSGPRYVTPTGLSEAFFSDTVENALRWWKAR